jgi:protein SCO1/2
MQAGARVPLWRNPYVWAFLVGCATVTLMRPLLRHIPQPPPVLGQLPEFSLLDARGQTFGNADLRDQVWVASFFFTRCPSVCPLLMTRMRSLQERYREAGIDAIRLLSITVDPANDTPERLRTAEEGYGVDYPRWRLLTGAPERVRELCVSGFRVPGFEDAVRADGDIPHTTKVVLVDGSGHIRGYYDTDESGLDEVFYRSQHVLEEMRKGAG